MGTPRGLSFDHLGANNIPVFVDVGDAYSTYHNDALGNLMAEDGGKIGTGNRVDEDALSEFISATLDWIQLAYKPK